MTRVTGLSGAPGKGGNSQALLTRFLDGAAAAGAQVSRVQVPALGLRGWTSDAKCGRDAPDAFHRVSRQMVEADVVAVASPLYFAGVPAQLKALIDLGQCYWLRKYVDREPLPPSAGGHSSRRGVFISTGGQDGQDFSGAVQTIQSFFDVYDIEYWAELLHGGVDGKAQIREEPLALQEAHDLGFRAVAEAWE